jgi:hypothetical protein
VNKQTGTSINIRLSHWEKTEIVKLAYEDYQGNLTDLIRHAMDRLIKKGVTA